MKKLLLTVAIIATSASAANAHWFSKQPPYSPSYAYTYPGHVEPHSSVVIYNERHYDWNYWGTSGRGYSKPRGYDRYGYYEHYENDGHDHKNWKHHGKRHHHHHAK